MSFWPPSRRSRRRRSHLELALEYISTGGGTGGSCLRDSAFKSIIIPNGNTLCEPLHVRAKNNFPRLINDLHHQIQAERRRAGELRSAGAALRAGAVSVFCLYCSFRSRVPTWWWLRQWQIRSLSLDYAELRLGLRSMKKRKTHCRIRLYCWEDFTV